MKQKKRRAVFPFQTQRGLKNRIIERLLPPRSRPGLTNHQLVKLFRKGKPAPADKWRDLAIEIINCFYPYNDYCLGLEPPNPKRERREAAASINRIKDLLRKNGLAAGEADQLIAEALGSSAGTLRQRLQRAK
jgi:hypothetical protein